MENHQEKSKSPKELCTITVMFPVDDDVAAIAVKQKVTDAVSDIADARIDFRIMKMGQHGPPIR